MVGVIISRDHTIRIQYIADALDNLPHLISHFPLPFLGRMALSYKFPRILRPLFSRYILWNLDRNFRESVARMYTLLSSEHAQLKKIVSQIKSVFGRPFISDITIVVTPHEWAMSRGNTISVGVRPPEILERLPVQAITHELLHVAFTQFLPTWNARGLSLLHNDESEELTIALLGQRLAMQNPASLDLAYVTQDLRAFAEQHRVPLERLLQSHDSPASLLSSVDNLVEHYMRTGEVSDTPHT